MHVRKKRKKKKDKKTQKHQKLNILAKKEKEKEKRINKWIIDVSQRERERVRETANIQWVRVRLCDSLHQPVKNKNKEKGEGRPR